MRVTLAKRVVRQLLEHFDGGAVAAFGGILDRGLEAVAHHDDDAGVEHLVDLFRRELQVVGLGAGRGEVGHGELVTGDPLGRPRQRIEASHDVAGATVVGRARREGQRPDDEQQDPALRYDNENESY